MNQTEHRMWYDNLPTERDRANRQAYAAWLRSFQWQIYFTLTFAYPISRGGAQSQFWEFVNALERHYRAPIGCLVAEEQYSWSGCGLAAVKVHYHGLLCCDIHLHQEVVKTAWHRLGHFGGNANAEVYDAERDAAGYCMKFMYQPDSNWDVGHLHHFVESTGPLNHAIRRRLSRRKTRLLTRSSTQTPRVS